MRRFLAIIFVFALFFYITMIYNSQSFMLLFFVGIILMVLLELFNFIAKGSLDVGCIIPKRTVRVGNDIIAEIHFKSDSVPSGRVMVCLVLRNISGKIKQKARVYGHAAADDDTVVLHAFSVNEVGIYSVQITKVRVFDYLGILGIPKSHKKEKQMVYVIPNIYTVPMDISEKYADIAVHMEPDLLCGTVSDENEQIREYVPGDSLHDIHWKLTAKKDAIMVRERTATGGIAIHLLLEGKKRPEKKNLIAFIQVAVSLSRGIAATGNVHYVAWFDGRQGEFVRVAVYEKRQVFEILWKIMSLDEDAWGEEPDSDIFAKEYKNKFGIVNLPCLLRLDRDLSLQLNHNELIKYKGTRIREQLCKNRLTF